MGAPISIAQGTYGGARDPGRRASFESGEAAANGARDLPPVWIAWETQRRSLGLAARVGAKLKLILYEDSRWLRYPLSIFRTLRLLGACRGRVVFVQNPSMILAALACFCKPWGGYFLVVDRHSNFSFLSGTPPGWRRRLSDSLSGYSLRLADLTVVTNSFLAGRVRSLGARPFVLPDPLPEIPPAALALAAQRTAPRPGQPAEILFVSSWAPDEPIAEAVEACRSLGDKVVVRITGKPKAAYASLLAGAPANFIPTGFLSDAEYFDRMAESDAVIAITRREGTLVCGGYEAIAMGKPLLLGDTRTLRDYFDAGAVYVGTSPGDLARGISALLRDFEALRQAIPAWRSRRVAEWDAKLVELQTLVGSGLRSLSAKTPAGPD